MSASAKTVVWCGRNNWLNFKTVSVNHICTVHISESEYTSKSKEDATWRGKIENQAMATPHKKIPNMYQDLAMCLYEYKLTYAGGKGGGRARNRQFQS